MNTSIITIIYRGIKAEFIKAKGTKLLLITVAVPVFIHICIFLIGKNTPLKMGVSKSWYDLTTLSITLLSFNMLLVAIVGMVSLGIQTENKANAWKHLLTLPIPQWSVFVNKLLFLLLLLAGVHVLLFVLTFITGGLLMVFRPELGIGNIAPDFYKMTGTTAKLMLSALPVFAIQYWLSLRIKNYIIPIFIGGFAVMIFTFAAMMGWGKTIYIPYAYPSLFDLWIKNQIHPTEMGGLPKFMWWGIIGFILLSIGAVLDAVFKRVKA